MSNSGSDGFSELKKEVFRLMDERLSSDLLYHHKDHTIGVIKAVEWLCDAENISGADRQLLKIAALFHDIGFIVSYEDHEKKSCDVARQILPKYDFPEDDIQSISELILATKVPHHPKNNLEEIICDADLAYLGDNDFYTIGEQLRQELILHNKIDKNDISWIQFQIRFLDTHKYFTHSCKIMREPMKQNFLRQLKDRLEEL